MGMKTSPALLLKYEQQFLRILNSSNLQSFLRNQLKHGLHKKCTIRLCKTYLRSAGFVTST